MKYSLIATFALTAVSAALAMPPVFSDLTFEDAKTQAAEQNKILIVDGTAEWCGPCKHMDRTTWVDPGVVEWIEAKAIAIQVDVDHQPDTAKELNITAMPTIIAFKGDTELGRFVGYRDARNTLAWLKSAESGEVMPQPARPVPSDPFGVDESLQLLERIKDTNELIHKGEYAKAREELISLWNNSKSPDSKPRMERTMVLSGVMGHLAEHDAESLEAFEAMRDALEDKLRDGSATYSELDDWTVLNGVVDDASRTLAWADRIKDRPNAASAFERFGWRLFNLCVSHERWELAAHVIGDPLRKAQEAHAVATQMRIRFADKPPWGGDEWLEKNLLRQLKRNAELHAAALAAGRLDDALEIARLALNEQDNAATRIQLVEYAARAGVALPQHLAWLDQAVEAGEDVAELRERIKPLMVKPGAIAARD